MWARSQPRAVLSGLKLPDGEITSDDAVREGLAQHWRQTFLWQSSDETAASELMNDVPEMPEIPPPTQAMVAHLVATAKNRSPGWDGLPSEAGRALGARAINMIWNTTVSLLAGRDMPVRWDSAAMVFQPKNNSCCCFVQMLNCSPARLLWGLS